MANQDTMNEYLGNLRVLLSKKMLDNNWSITELSVMCNVSYHTMRNIVNGGVTDMNLSTLDKICKSVNISYLDIFGVECGEILQNQLDKLIISDKKRNHYKIQKI